MSKPFRDIMSGFTPLPNEITDRLISDPNFSNAELRVLLVILRETTGWGRDFTTTSYSELRELSGIGSPATISKALRGLEGRGLIVFEAGSGASQSVVGLNPDWDPDAEDWSELGELVADDLDTETVLVQKVNSNSAVGTTETVQPSISKKKIERNRRAYPKPPPMKRAQRPKYTAVRNHPPEPKSGMYNAAPNIMALADAFKEMTGLFYNPGTWDDKWEKPLTALLEATGSQEKAEKVMRESVNVLREKRYTIASPASIHVTAVNLANMPEPKKETLTR